MYIPRIGTYFLKVHFVGILMRPQVWRYVHLEAGFYFGWAAKAAFGALVQYPSVTVFDVPHCMPCILYYEKYPSTLWSVCAVVIIRVGRCAAF